MLKTQRPMVVEEPYRRHQIRNYTKKAGAIVSCFRCQHKMRTASEATPSRPSTTPGATCGTKKGERRKEEGRKEERRKLRGTITNGRGGRSREGVKEQRTGCLVVLCLSTVESCLVPTAVTCSIQAPICVFTDVDINTSVVVIDRTRNFYCCVAGQRPLRWGCHGAGMNQGPWLVVYRAH